MKRLWGSEHSSGEALDLLGSLQYSDDADAKSCNVVARFEHLAPDLDAVSTWSGVNVRTKWQKPSTEKCKCSGVFWGGVCGFMAMPRKQLSGTSFM